MKTLICCVLFFAGSNAWLWPKKASYEKLYVTFLKFDRMPVTKSDAVSKGWKLTKSCDASNAFAGNRYVLNGDIATMLLLDNNGLLAGIQMGVSKSEVPAKSAPWVSEGDMYVITAYFRDPSSVCSPVTKRHVTKEYGDRLVIQNGASISSLITIPYKEEGLKGSSWVEGKCFPLMGQHYWYNISNNMNCEDFYPVFIMYNGGELNGFGWNIQKDLKSLRYEHPTPDKLKYFFHSATRPKCLDTAGPLTTQHIYMDWPYNNICYLGK
ncbi:uncharacterized protein LOC116601181 [Nematostella vectensis]|uniref:uncharacterized protein LOC116601181 n=1 Tax=Nematostella vectensis TaxID=45351 RepID=UPI00139022B0|nr:uncharacterized protein LOC116601181 [Nematostella vectensis]